MIDIVLSAAIVAFVGFGSSNYPILDDNSAIIILSAYNRQDDINIIEEIIEEQNSIPVDWNGKSLVDGGRYVQSIMADRHPELTPEALEALYWKFTFDWR